MIYYYIKAIVCLNHKTDRFIVMNCSTLLHLWVKVLLTGLYSFYRNQVFIQVTVSNGFFFMIPDYCVLQLLVALVLQYLCDFYDNCETFKFILWQRGWLHRQAGSIHPITGLGFRYSTVQKFWATLAFMFCLQRVSLQRFQSVQTVCLAWGRWSQ